MHKTLAEARELVQEIRGGLVDQSGIEIALFPAFPLLFPMAKAIAGSKIQLGGQNCHEAPEGAFTGEVSVPMLKDTGCTYALVGHSERRHVFGEQGPTLGRKLRSVVQAGLRAVYCVGETLAEREGGRTDQTVNRQMDEVLKADVPPDRLVLAYEPVWAIGTGKNATPEQAQEVHAKIRSHLASIYDQAVAGTIRIMYGGSVKPGNARSLAEQPDIDGMLVGGASLVAADFLAIISAVAAAQGRAR